MSKFGFIILHYQTIEETKNCIASIQKCLTDENYVIIVVDNASPDGTGKRLLDQYSEDIRVKVLLNNENLGYARGNNVGFSYAKNVLKCDYITLLNSDTVMIQKEFCKIIEKEYLDSHCAVMGPLILKNGKETINNPGRRKPFSKGMLIMFIWMNKLLWVLSFCCLDLILAKLFDLYVMLNKKIQTVEDVGRVENVALHGCCLVLTPLFIDNEDGLDPRTYMYLEEDILYEKMRMKHLTMVYLPELKIEHIEEVTTTKSFGNKRYKRRFIYKNMIHSGYVLLQIKKNN